MLVRTSSFADALNRHFGIPMPQFGEKVCRSVATRTCIVMCEFISL